MALTFRVDIVSAEAVLLSATVEAVFAPAQMGEVGIYPRHAPLLTRLRPGFVRVVHRGGREESFVISGGFLEVQPHVVTVLADTALRTEGLDLEAAMAAKERAEASMKEKLAEAEYAKLKAELDQTLKLFRAMEEIRKKRRR